MPRQHQQPFAEYGESLKKPTLPPGVFADLHTHSTASDGVHPATELVRMAADLGLHALAVTDHDTIGGVAEAQAAAAAIPSLELVAGIELSCSWPDRDESLHVLGLFFDFDPVADCPLHQLLHQMRDARRKRAQVMTEKLQKLGYDMTRFCDRLATDGQTAFGRPHLARHLVDIKAVSSFDQAFDQLLLRGRPAYEPKPHLPPDQAIAAIHARGGLAIWAHPGLIREWSVVWPRLENLDFDGLEVYHPDHEPNRQEELRQLAAAKKWLVGGGSDYHGSASVRRKQLGQTGLNREEYLRLREAKR